jgi:predicted RecA/RadA family phage recombinase
MRNYNGTADVVTLTAPAGGVVGGTGYVIGATFVVPVASAAAGVQFAGQRTGLIVLPKATGAGTDIAEGARLWWDNTAKRVEKASATGRFPLGCAGTGGAAIGATEVEVALDAVATVAAP